MVHPKTLSGCSELQRVSNPTCVSSCAYNLWESLLYRLGPV
jgi:hypothetical protein